MNLLSHTHTYTQISIYHAVTQNIHCQTKKEKLRQGKEKLTKATENNIQKQIEEEIIILTLGSR